MPVYYVLESHRGQAQLVLADIQKLKELVPSQSVLLDLLSRDGTLEMTEAEREGFVRALRALNLRSLSKEAYVRSTTHPELNKLSAAGLIAQLVSTFESSVRL